MQKEEKLPTEKSQNHPWDQILMCPASQDHPREDSRQLSWSISYGCRSKQKAACGQSSLQPGCLRALLEHATPSLPTACGPLPLAAEMES